MSVGLVLASASLGRRLLLERAGVAFRVEAASIDEEAVTASLREEGAPIERATETLAELKALRVGPRHPGALILGADTMLECAGRWLGKAADLTEAREVLRALAGREHGLVTTAVLMRDGARIWHRTAVARLVMRRLSEAFLDDYLDAVGERACDSVGCYQIEGRGLQLFSRIEGDLHGIIGLPMLDLLDMLRRHGVLRS